MITFAIGVATLLLIAFLLAPPPKMQAFGRWRSTPGYRPVKSTFGAVFAIVMIAAVAMMVPAWSIVVGTTIAGALRLAAIVVALISGGG